MHAVRRQPDDAGVRRRVARREDGRASPTTSAPGGQRRRQHPAEVGLVDLAGSDLLADVRDRGPRTPSGRATTTTRPPARRATRRLAAGLARTSRNRAAVTLPSKVTTTAHQPAESSAAGSSADLTEAGGEPAAEPRERGSSLGEPTDCRLGGRRPAPRSSRVDRRDLVGDVAVLVHRRHVAADHARGPRLRPALGRRDLGPEVQRLAGDAGSRRRARRARWRRPRAACAWRSSPSRRGPPGCPTSGSCRRWPGARAPCSR